MDKKNNVILNLNPITSLSMIAFFSLSGALFNIKYVAIILVVLLVTAGIAGVLKAYTKMWLKTIVLLTVIVFLLQSLLLPGETIAYTIFGLKIKQEALNVAIPICSRILGIGSPLVLMTKIIDFNRLATALEQKGVSATATYVILSALNMIPQMGKRMHDILDAQKCRGIETEGNVLVRAKAFFPVIGPMILTSILGVEERAITLDSRGFSSKRPKTRLMSVADTSKDKLIRNVFWGLCAAAVIWRIVLWVL